MTDNERRIFDLHVEREDLQSIKFELMSKLLDEELIKDILKERQWKALYIYGGAPLGIQVYRTFNKFIPVHGIIDKSGTTKIHVENVKVYLPTDKIYMEDDDPIIITPIEYSDEIIEDLVKYVKCERIIQINELF